MVTMSAFLCLSLGGVSAAISAVSTDNGATWSTFTGVLNYGASYSGPSYRDGNSTFDANAVVLDWWMPLITGGAPPSFSTPCEVATFWTMPATQTTSSNFMAVFTLFAHMFCGVGRESGRYIANTIDAGFIGMAVWVPNFLPVFASQEVGPFYADYDTGNFPLWFCGGDTPAHNPTVPLLAFLNANATHQAVLVSGVSPVMVRFHDDQTRILKAVRGLEGLWIFNGVASCVLLLVAIETMYRMRRSVLSWPFVAVVFEGIFAASLRIFRMTVEPIYYSCRMSFAMTHFMYYWDMLLSHVANIILMVIYARLALDLRVDTFIKKSVFNVFMVGIIVGCTAPVLKLMVDISRAPKDLTLARLNDFIENVGDWTSDVRDLQLGFVFAVVVAYALSSIVVVTKLLRAAKSGSAKLSSQSKTMLMFILPQIVLMALNIWGLWLDANGDEDATNDDAGNIETVFVTKGVCTVFLGFLQVISLRQYSSSSSSSST
jgi:hypothetical protein